ncbi:MAG: hypothetical protein U1F55_09020 [Chitinivorax sp.]
MCRQRQQLRLDSLTLPLSLAYAGNAALVAISQRSSLAIGVDLVWRGRQRRRRAVRSERIFPRSNCRQPRPASCQHSTSLFQSAMGKLEAALKAAQLTLADIAG